MATFLVSRFSQQFGSRQLIRASARNCNNRLRLSRAFFSSEANNNGDTTTSSGKPLDIVYGPVNALQMNQYAIACTSTNQAVLVDCGASTQHELDGFLQWMQTNNYNLEAVWQTHAHLDHVAGLGLLRGLSEYSDIPIYLHPLEREIYNSFEGRRKEFGFPVEGDGILPDDTTLTYFDSEDADKLQQLTLGDLSFDIFSCPGHSPGHVGFFEPASKSFLGGDFIMQGSVGRTDFPTSSPEDMQASLKRFVTMMEDYDDENVVIYPGHGAPTTLNREKEYNPFLQGL